MFIFCFLAKFIATTLHNVLGYSVEIQQQVVAYSSFVKACSYTFCRGGTSRVEGGRRYEGAGCCSFEQHLLSFTTVTYYIGIYATLIFLLNCARLWLLVLPRQWLLEIVARHLAQRVASVLLLCVCVVNAFDKIVISSPFLRSFFHSLALFSIRVCFWFPKKFNEAFLSLGLISVLVGFVVHPIANR